MYTHIIGIKEVFHEQYTIDYLLELDNKDARTFLQSNNIIIIRMQTYADSIEYFGNIYGTITYHDTNIGIVGKRKNIEDACKELFFLWFNVTSINSFINPIDNQQAVQKIHTIQTQIQTIQHKIQGEIEQKNQQIQSLYTDKNDAQIDSFIQNAISDIEDIKRESSKQMQKKADQYNAMLKKAKASTNVEKTIEILEEVYQFIHTIQINKLQSQNTKTIFPETNITNIDIDENYYIVQESQKLQNMGLQTSRNQKILARTKNTGIIIKLAYKDIVQSILQHKIYNTKNIWTTARTIIMISICIWICFALIAQFQDKTTNRTNIIQLWIIGIAIHIGYQWDKTKGKTNQAIVLAIASYIIIYYTVFIIFVL